MGELFDKIIEIILQQGIAGAMLVVLGWAYYKQGRRLEALHALMYEEAEKDNVEKLGYLNNHIVILEKTKAAMESQNEVLKDIKSGIEKNSSKLSEMKGKLNG